MFITYRDLFHYKYRLVADYYQDTDITGFEVDHRFIKLTISGKLDVLEGYSWDGPSGPTYDTGAFMRGSLVHDAFYQLIRLEKIPPRYRKTADLLLKSMCLEDGMHKFRAGYTYYGARWFAKRAGTPGYERHPYKEYKAPDDTSGK